MTESPDNRPKFSDQQALRLWAAYVKSWGKLLSDRMMADAKRCEGLGEFEQAYLRAFWQDRMGRLRKLNIDPLPIPARTGPSALLARVDREGNTRQISKLERVAIAVTRAGEAGHEPRGRPA